MFDFTHECPLLSFFVFLFSEFFSDYAQEIISYFNDKK